MLLLSSTTEKVQLITSAAADIEVHRSYVDNASGTITPGGGPLASITTATTTDVVAAPGASTQRAVQRLSARNNSGSTACVCTYQITDGTNVVSLWSGTLNVGESVVMGEDGQWVAYTSAGIPKVDADYTVFNASTADQGAGFATDTYLTGSFVPFPIAPKVGAKYRLIFDVTKTAAGTATPIVTVRFGTAGSTSDTARNTITFAAGTAAASTARCEVIGHFRTVGSGTAAVFVATGVIWNTGTTGVIGAACGVVKSTSAGFDSTVAGLGVGVSVNGGTSAAWTVSNVEAEIVNAV
jgi:hypothetical protein